MLFNTILIIHVVAGAATFIVAPAAMIVRKGGDAHRRWGKLFFYFMTVVFVTALFMSVSRWSPFLLMIAVLSYYSVVSGYRALYHKLLHTGRGVTLLDWTAGLVALLFNLTFAGYGIYQLMNGNTGLAILSIMFSSIGISFSVSNLLSFVRPPTTKSKWFFSHISGMMAGFIASVTAFSAQVMTFLPGIVPWVWPTVAGTILITYWTTSYRRKLAAGAKVHELVLLRREAHN